MEPFSEAHFRELLGYDPPDQTALLLGLVPPPEQASNKHGPSNPDPFAVDPADDPPNERSVPSSAEPEPHQQFSNEPAEAVTLYQKVFTDKVTGTWFLTARYREHVIHIAGRLSSLTHPKPSATLSHILQATHEGLQGNSDSLCRAAQATMDALMPKLSLLLGQPRPGLRTLREFMAAQHMWARVFAEENGTLAISNTVCRNGRFLVCDDFPDDAQVGRAVAVGTENVHGIDAAPRINLYDYDVVDAREAFARQTVIVRERASGPGSQLLVFKPASGTSLYIMGLTMQVAVYNQMRARPDSALRCFAALKGIALDRNGLVVGYLVEGMGGTTALTKLTELPALEQRLAWMQDILEASLELFSIGYMWGMPRPDGVLIDPRRGVRLRGLHGPGAGYIRGMDEIREYLGIREDVAETDKAWDNWPVALSGYPQVTQGGGE